MESWRTTRYDAVDSVHTNQRPSAMHEKCVSQTNLFVWREVWPWLEVRHWRSAPMYSLDVGLAWMARMDSIAA